MTHNQTPLVPSPTVLRVLDGAVDLHCHSAPSPFPRRVTHAEAAADGARINMRAILVKSHHHSTVMDVLSMAPLLAPLSTQVFGGIALNTEVGGVNPSAVALALGMGGRCVWAPTVSSAQHMDAHKHDDGFPSTHLDLREKVEPILDSSGEISAEMNEITGMVAEAGALLTGGHLAPGDMKQLFRNAHGNGVRRLLVHHPDFIIGASESDLEEMLGYGAFVEHELAMYHPDVAKPAWPIEQLVDWIEKIGPERTVIDSDLGQQGNPLPVDGYIYVVTQLLEHGISEESIRQMVCRNTAYLLGLEDTPR